MKSLRGFLRRKLLETRLEQPPVVFVQHVEGLEIKFAVHTWVEYHNRARDSYTGEPDTVAWIKENLRSGDTLWDIGANVGAYSLLAAKIVPDALVVAFEPYIPTFAHLWDNIVLNNLQDRIQPLCVGLSDCTAMNVLGISDPRAGSSEHVLGKRHSGLMQPALAMKSDDVVNILHVKPPSLIKVDVDGYELPVLRGMKEILQQRSLRSLIIEVEKDRTEADVSETLAAEGFQRLTSCKPCTEESTYNVVYERYAHRLR
jgi:FkbM family methyltransferase